MALKQRSARATFEPPEGDRSHPGSEGAPGRPRMIQFGTSGWRAIISDTFTFRNVRLVTQAITNVVLEGARQGGDPEPRIVVGYDTRFLSEKVAAETASVL